MSPAPEPAVAYLQPAEGKIGARCQASVQRRKQPEKNDSSECKRGWFQPTGHLPADGDQSEKQEKAGPARRSGECGPSDLFPRHPARLSIREESANSGIQAGGDREGGSFGSGVCVDSLNIRLAQIELLTKADTGTMG